MFTATEIAEFRAMAESLMQDQLEASSPGVTLPDQDGMEVETWQPQGQTRGKIQARSQQGDTTVRATSVGGVDRPVIEGGLHIPIGAPCPQIGWEYRCVSVGPASDPVLVGRRYRVVDVPAKSFATARRLDVVEV